LAWSQAATYTGVTITMPLEDNTLPPIGGVEGTVYLTNQIGPGTTSANNVATPVQISGLTGAFVTTSLFSGLTLPPGTYYLTLVPTNTNPMTSSPEGSSGGNINGTTGTSVTSVGGGVPGAVAGFPPASSVTLSTPDNIFVTVTGTLASTPTTTPAPSSLILMMVTAALAAGVWFVRRKFAAA
jgi:hypothetical protein